jgi:hypothetical protein
MSPSKDRFVGLVDASGSAGACIGKSDAWRLAFHLAAWHQPGAAVVRDKLRCELPIAKDELNALMRTVKAYSILDLEATSTANGVTNLHRIAPAVASDPELESIAKDLQTPVELLSPFGCLVYDRRFGWYAGRTAWCAKEIEINLSCADPANTGGVLQIASTLFSSQREWSQRIQAYAVQKLLPLKNDAWLSEGEKQISAEDFTSRMRLTSLSIEETGTFWFWHNDGDLFWGHSIQIGGDIVNGLTDADISG